MSVPMAIVDYFPVALFLAGALVLQRDLYHEMSKGAFALFSAGTITIFMAGLFKASWKLLYALSVCDFEPLNKCFFPMQTTGFVLSFVFVLGMGYLSGKDFTIPAMNWLAEGVNTIGQGAFLVGAKLLADGKKQAA